MPASGMPSVMTPLFPVRTNIDEALIREVDGAPTPGNDAGGAAARWDKAADDDDDAAVAISVV